MPQLPTGTVTFMFTDIEGSTRLLQRVGEGYPDLLAEHHRIVRDAIAAGGGTEVGTEGDSFFAVFPTASGALQAAIQTQRGLASDRWRKGHVIRVRIGLHTGQGVLSGGQYVGLDVHRAARIRAASHGGQVLISDTTRALAGEALPVDVSVRDLGRHRLKDIELPERLHHLVIQGLESEFPPIRTLDARLTNLPLERSSFVGREREAVEASSLLERSRLLTLTGPGGTGKTRLALKIAGDQLGRFADGVYLVDLSPITDPSLVPAAIAGALVVREQPGRDLTASLVEHLRDRELLLVLDNMEQVVDAAETVRRLLDAARGLTVLTTSRIPLHLTGEQEFPVPPLGLPDPTRHADPESVNDNEAVVLFVQRAASVRPGFSLTADNAAAVAGIAVRLEGLPLAIELAASRAKLLDPRTILSRLGSMLSLPTGPDDLPDRQRTLRSTIKWSYDLLEPEHQRLFARLGTFRGGWMLKSAELVCGPGLDIEVLDGLATLVDHSVVGHRRVEDGQPRFSMLETIREFALERLAATGERDELQRRHAENFRNLAEEAELHLTRQEKVVWLARLEHEIDNLRATLDWAEATGEASTGLRAAAAIWRFWQQRGQLSEGRERLERLLAIPSAAPRDEVRARALGALGGITYWQNDNPVTRTAYQEAVDIAREVGDPRLLASALLDLSFVPSMERDADKAELILREGLAAAQETGDRLLIADFWDSIAWLDVIRGKPADAIPVRRSAIEIFRAEGDVWKVANNLIGLAMLSRMAGDVDAARDHLREALGMFTQVKDTMSIPGVLTGLALVANEDGIPGRAARLVGAAARIRDDVGGGIPPELFATWGDPAADARRALGDDAYEAARAAGYAMDPDSAVAFAADAT